MDKREQPSQGMLKTRVRKKKNKDDWKTHYQNISRRSKALPRLPILFEQIHSEIESLAEAVLTVSKHDSSQKILQQHKLLIQQVQWELNELRGAVNFKSHCLSVNHAFRLGRFLSYLELLHNDKAVRQVHFRKKRAKETNEKKWETPKKKKDEYSQLLQKLAKEYPEEKYTALCRRAGKKIGKSGRAIQKYVSKADFKNI